MEYCLGDGVRKEWFLMEAGTLKDQQCGVVLTCTNISSQKRYELQVETSKQEALRARDELSDANAQTAIAIEIANELNATLHLENHNKNLILSALPSVLIIVDYNLVITEWTGGAEHVFGVTANAAVGNRIEQVALGVNWTEIEPALSACLTKGQTMRLDDCRFRRSNGSEGILGITCAPIPMADSENWGALIVGADITDRRALEGQLAHSQKLEGIGQLAAGIAHEINTPSQYIGDNVRFVQQGLKDICSVVTTVRKVLELPEYQDVKLPGLTQIRDSMREADIDFLTEEIPPAIEQTLEGISHVNRIVSAMKDFSHPGSDKKVSSDVNRLLDSTITVTRNEWKYVAEVVTTFAPDLPTILCFPGDLNQVFLNVIINAAHAISDANEALHQEKGTIHISTHQTDVSVLVKIRDSGTGIPLHARAHVFDPFYTTKEVGRGTGQGLSIAHNIVKARHGGDIWFETECGVGTTFIIELPLSGALKEHIR
jgi:PAS domain S-box-containing protein